MIDRIDALRAEAESAIAAATTTAALEEVRVRALGRKAELPNLLRGVAELGPRSGAGSARRPTRPARRWRRPSRPAAPSWSSASWPSGWPATAST